jgi:hypothetical protein
MYLASIHATSTLGGSARIHTGPCPCFSSVNPCHHTGRSHEPARTANAHLTVSSAHVPNARGPSSTMVGLLQHASTLGRGRRCGTHPQDAAGGSAKHALTYSRSSDPILDPPLILINMYVIQLF